MKWQVSDWRCPTPAARNFPLYVEQALLAYRLAKSNLGATCQIDQPQTFGPALEGVLGETRFTTAAREFAGRYEKFDVEASVDRIVEIVDSQN